MSELVGRVPELARLREAWAGARAGRGSALLVSGEAGIGKSAVLAEVVRAADESIVLRTVGRENERELAYAALATLLAPCRHRLSELPSAQAAALRTALAIEVGPPPDPFAIGAATLGLLALVAEEQPLLCIVDDAPWLDPASAAAIGFAARRIDDLPVLLVLAARDGGPLPAQLEGLIELKLGPLTDAEAAELVGRTGGEASRLVSLARGNPLALIELGRSADENRADIPLRELPPVGETVVALFRSAIARLPEHTRAALLRAAADRRALGDTGALDPAERAGLVALGHGLVEFRHPLLRSAVYHGAAAPERRRVHAEIAASLTSPEDLVRRALHLALAATEPDESVAAELEETARWAVRLGGVSEAATLLASAARLSPRRAERASRRAATAELQLFAGDPAAAAASLELAAREAPDERTEVTVQRMRGILDLWLGNGMAAHSTLVAAGARAAALDPALAAEIYIAAVWPAFTAARLEEALVAATRAHELAEEASPELSAQAATLLGATLVLSGRAGPRDMARSRVEALLPRDALLDSVAANYGLTLVWLESYDDATALVTEAIERARAAAALTTLPLLLAVRCELATWRGDLRSALAAGREAERLCEQIGVHVSTPYVLATLARAEAITGLDHEAVDHAKRALAIARPVGVDSIELYAANALALASLAAGRPAEAAADLRGLRALCAERGVGEPNAVPWLSDLVEAAHLSGDDALAAGALADLERLATATGSGWAAGVAARGRALRAGLEEGEAELEQSVRLLAHVPFEQARSRLVLGELLRRGRRRRDARTPLRDAYESFRRMGAEPWAARARRELAAAGEPVESPDESIEQLLSPQELQVALLVTEGLTNREAAARMIVSPKTIEYHLANAYQKLGVRSRVELVRRLD